MTKSDQTEITTYDTSERSLPVLPVRDTVLFPHAVLPLTVGYRKRIDSSVADICPRSNSIHRAGTSIADGRYFTSMNFWIRFPDSTSPV